MCPYYKGLQDIYGTPWYVHGHACHDLNRAFWPIHIHICHIPSKWSTIRASKPPTHIDPDSRLDNYCPPSLLAIHRVLSKITKNQAKSPVWWIPDLCIQTEVGIFEPASPAKTPLPVLLQSLQMLFRHFPAAAERFAHGLPEMTTQRRNSRVWNMGTFNHRWHRDIDGVHQKWGFFNQILGLNQSKWRFNPNNIWPQCFSCT